MSRPGLVARPTAVLPRLGLVVVLLLAAGAVGSTAASAAGHQACAVQAACPAGWARTGVTTPPGSPMPPLGGVAGGGAVGGEQDGRVGAGQPGLGQNQQDEDGGIPGGDLPAGTRPGSGTAPQQVADEGSGLGRILLAVAALAALGAVALLVASRRRPAAVDVAGGRSRIAWGTPGAAAPSGPVRYAEHPATNHGGRTVADAVREVQHVDVLTAALREVALHGPSDAIRQQVERLLNGSRVRREDLVDSCVRYRDQLAERDPALAAHLLGALAQAGVTEMVADGEAFDPHRHQSMDVQDTPYAYLRDVVAATTRPGYLDNGRVLRLPEVIVYRFVPTGGQEGQRWNAAQ
jgi:hypothetical protein